MAAVLVVVETGQPGRDTCPLSILALSDEAAVSETPALSALMHNR